MSESPSIDRRAVLAQALHAVEDMQARLDASEAGKREPIAIVGIGCRYPGGVADPDSYWRLLRDGVDATREVPADRWNADDYYDADKDAVGKMITRRGGFLDSVDTFDPGFFGISPREAATLDPQQRLLLEVTWEALEDSGTAADSLRGSSTGVFVGITTSDYAKVIGLGQPGQTDVYAATGNALNAAAGRVSFVLGLNGPCMAVDTACSSSLVAIHLACQSLRNRESNLALAGGVNLVLLPEAAVLFSKWGMLAPDGRCKTFDASADGFVRSEGCGMVVLKRLSDAISASDRVVAVIRSSAVNQDGASSGLTVPNGPAQEAVIRTALDRAGLDPADVDYVEAHGTGTPLGDPIEFEALAAAFDRDRSAHRPLLIGSVKTNIGHAEAASGVAGLIKVALALDHGEMPPHLHFKDPSPRIPWANHHLAVPTTLRPWPRSERPRLAGVSSFGFSGTNAHVILGEAPVDALPALSPSRDVNVLAFSARSEKALSELSLKLADRLAASTADLNDFARSLALGRAPFAHRAALTAVDTVAAVERLRAVATGREREGIVRGQARGEAPKVVFLFTGQGSQQPAMGAELYRTEPAYREVLDACESVYRGETGESLLAVMHGAGDDRLNATQYTQPSLFALEYGLSMLWRSWGVEPAAVLGHSVGEYVAACVAGVLAFDDALRLVIARGRLMGALPDGGGMTAVQAPESTVREALRAHADLSVAAVNGPDSIVASGNAESLGKLEAALQSQGVKTQRLAVSHAFHSRLMEPMLDGLEASARSLHHMAPTLDYVSNVTGALIEDHKMGAGYWVRHTREAVRFSDGIAELRRLGYGTFIEIGPQPVLSGLAQRFVDDASCIWLPSLRKGRGDTATLLDSIAKAWVKGVRIDWSRFYPGSARKVALPTYPFQRERHWTQAPDQAVARGSGSMHPFLYSKLRLAYLGDAYLYAGQLGIPLFPYFRDHRIEQGVVVPATAYTEMALAACTDAWGLGAVRFHHLEFRKPLFLSEDGVHDVQVFLSRSPDGNVEYRIASRPASSAPSAPWSEHAVGQLAPETRPPEVTRRREPDAIRRDCPEEISGQDFYRHVHARGNEWGPTFQGVSRLWRGQREAWAEITVPAPIESQVARYQLHPAVADACGHVLTATQSLPPDDGPRGGAFVGGGIEDIRVYGPIRGTRFLAHAVQREDPAAPANVLLGDVRLFDETGNVVSELQGARLWYLSGQASPARDVSDWLYEVGWSAAPPDAEAPRGRTSRWLIVEGSPGSGAALAAALTERGRPAAAVTENDVLDADDESLARILGLGHDVIYLHAGGAGEGNDVRRSGTLTAARLIQGLLRLPDNDRGRLWVATRGAQSVTANDAVDPWGGALWGLGRSAALEASEVWGGLVDLAGDAEFDRTLLDAVETSTVGDQVALRGLERFSPRLRRLRPEKGRGARLLPGAAYLVTGGLGGLGLEVAADLARQGARRLVLMGRTPLPPRSEWSKAAEPRTKAVIAAIRAIEGQGCSVHVASVDVGDEAAVRAWAAAWEREGWPVVRGIVHCAGIVQYKPLAQHDEASLADVFRAKVGGLRNLDETFGEACDFIVLYSSASAVLSSPLLSGYAAANAFLDSYAQHARQRNRRMLSVNWGMWSDVGMVTQFDAAGVEALALKGMGSLSAQQGLEALRLLLATPVAQAAVLPVAWEQWRRRYAALAAAPFLSEVMGTDPAAAAARTQADDARSHIRAASAAERPALVEAFVGSQIARVLELDEHGFDRSAPIKDFGLDSLMAVEIRNRIESSLGVSLPLVAILEGPSARELATLVSARLGDAVAGGASAVAKAPSAEQKQAEKLLARIDDMSETELNRLLGELAGSDDE